MAITIPSKNIYGTPSNNKVIKNKIDNVSVGQTVVTPDNDYETTVYNEKITQTFNYTGGRSNSDVFSKTDDSGSIRGFWVGYTNIKIGYFRIPIIKIPKVKENAYISKLFYGLDKDKTPNIKYTVHYKKDVFAALTTTNLNFNSSTIGGTQLIQRGQYISSSEQNGTIVLPESYTKEYYPYYGQWSHTASNNVTVEYSYDKEENIGSESILSEDNDYYYLNNISIVGSAEINSLFGWDYKSLGDSDWQTATKKIELNGTQEVLLADTLEITVYGNTIGISLSDGSYSYTMGSQHPYSLNGNELLQDSATTVGNQSNRVPIADYLAQYIYAEYKNGKETAVIRCSIPEDLSVFEIGDEVIPMVFGADGVDRPMSRYKDGTPKVFNVVGTKFIYDGAVWQELTLQEKTQSV